MEKCKKCGSVINEGEKFCSNCGEKVEEIKNIETIEETKKVEKSEENKIEKNNKNIEEVSEKIVSGVKETISGVTDNGQEFIGKINRNEKVQEGKEKVKKNSNTIMGTIAIIIVLILVGFISVRFIFNPASSPERTVKNFVEALNDYDLEEAMEFTNIDDWLKLSGIPEEYAESMYNSEMMDYYLDGYADEYMNIEIIDVNEVYKNDKSATVTVTTSVVFEGEFFRNTENINLIKDDGKWLIDIYQYSYLW